MLVGSEIGAALTALERAEARRARPQLRHRPAGDDRAPALPRRSTARVPDLVPAQRRAAVDRRRPHPLRPHARPSWPSSTRRFITELGVEVVGGCCGTTPEHLAPVVDAVPRPGAAAPRARRRAGAWRRSTRRCRSTRTTPSSIIGERTNANGSKAFRDAMLAGDWDTCVQMANDQIREGAHVLDVCVDYVGPRRHRRHGRDRAAGSPPRPRVPLVLDSTEPPVMEAGAAAHRRPGHPQLGQPGGRRAARAAGSTGSSRWPASTARAVICLLHRRAGPGPRRRVEAGGRPPHPRDRQSSATGSTPSDLIFDALTFPLSTGDDDLRRDAHGHDRGHPAHQGGDPGRLHHARRVQRVASASSPAARHVLNRVFLHECVAGRPRLPPSSTPARIMPLNKIPDEQRDVCLDLIYDRRRPTATTRCRSCSRCSPTSKRGDGREGGPLRLAGRGAAEAPHHRRRPRRPRSPTSTRRWPAGCAALDIVNDVLLDGMKVVGELFGSGQMQLPFVLQSAETMKTAVAYLEPHMERVDGQTSKGRLVLGHGQGRRPRHRQEPGRHHPHQQRLRGATTSASRCRSPTWWPRSRRSTPTPSA